MSPAEFDPPTSSPSRPGHPFPSMGTDPDPGQETGPDGSSPVQGSPVEGSAELAEAEVTPVFPTLEDFVTRYLAKVVRRRFDRTLSWCPSWWAHHEAVERLTAMWVTFELARVKGSGSISNWWVRHADPHLREMMNAATGPFSYCDPVKGHQSRIGPLPTTPAPVGWWVKTKGGTKP